jgi:hypothetical protein
MATKKGIILTLVILVGITAVSFLVWLIPQDTQFKIVVSDYDANLNGVIEIRNTIEEGLEESFQSLLDKKISAEEYIQMAEVSSSQINSQIIQLIESKPPTEWTESYSRYIESLKTFNTQIRETIVVANMIKNNSDESKIQENLATISKLKQDSELLLQASEQARP